MKKLFLLGNWSVRLVFPSVLSVTRHPNVPDVAPDMVLLGEFLAVILLGGFCLGFASLGITILRSLRLEMSSDAEHILLSIAVGLVAIEVLLFLIQPTQHIRLACVALAVLLFVDGPKIAVSFHFAPPT